MVRRIEPSAKMHLEEELPSQRVANTVIDTEGSPDVGVHRAVECDHLVPGRGEARWLNQQEVLELLTGVEVESYAPLFQHADPPAMISGLLALRNAFEIK